MHSKCLYSIVMHENANTITQNIKQLSHSRKLHSRSSKFDVCTCVLGQVPKSLRNSSYGIEEELLWNVSDHMVDAVLKFIKCFGSCVVHLGFHTE